jgi:hypothetical protein
MELTMDISPAAKARVKQLTDYPTGGLVIFVGPEASGKSHAAKYLIEGVGANFLHKAIPLGPHLQAIHHLTLDPDGFHVLTVDGLEEKDASAQDEFFTFVINMGLRRMIYIVECRSLSGLDKRLLGFGEVIEFDDRGKA